MEAKGSWNHCLDSCAKTWGTLIQSYPLEERSAPVHLLQHETIMMLGKWLVSLCMLVSTVDSRPQDQDHEMCTLPYYMHYVEGCEATHLMARRPKRMPSSGPRLIVVRARRLAGAWQVRALIRRWLPFPALAVYTAACRTSP